MVTLYNEAEEFPKYLDKEVKLCKFWRITTEKFVPLSNVPLSIVSFVECHSLTIAFNSNKECYSQGKDTCSEIGKHNTLKLNGSLITSQCYLIFPLYWKFTYTCFSCTIENLFQICWHSSFYESISIHIYNTRIKHSSLLL